MRVAGIVCVLLALSFPDIDSRVVKKFTDCIDFFFKGKPPVIPGILERSEPQTDGFRVICQKYKNKIRFATLYNTTGKIPVFSAYKYTGTEDFKKPQAPNIWMTEPQLEPTRSAAEMREPFVNQARNEDYWMKSANNYIPGTLFPTNHTADKETSQSTFTLTNSVPQNNKFKEGIWNLVETVMKTYMDNNCRDHNNNTVAYVLTGIIPGNKTLNERVNIPSHVWTAFCCYNSATRSWDSKTYNATNKSYNENNIVLRSLEYLQTILRREWGEVELFNKNCQ